MCNSNVSSRFERKDNGYTSKWPWYRLVVQTVSGDWCAETLLHQKRKQLCVHLLRLQNPSRNAAGPEETRYATTPFIYKPKASMFWDLPQTAKAGDSFEHRALKMNKQFFFLAGVCLLAYVAVEVSAQYGTMGYPAAGGYGGYGGYGGAGGYGAMGALGNIYGGNSQERAKYQRNLIAYRMALRDWQQKASRTIVIRNALNDLARASTFTKWTAAGREFMFLTFEKRFSLHAVFFNLPILCIFVWRGQEEPMFFSVIFNKNCWSSITIGKIGLDAVF